MHDNENRENDRFDAELQKLKLEIEKLQIENSTLVKSRRFDFLQRMIPFITIIVTALGFCFSVVQYQAEQRKNREAQEKQSNKEIEERIEQSRKNRETDQREFMRPLLSKQSELYLEASSAAATIATSEKRKDVSKATDTFWRLYYGPLIFVENTQVAVAMEDFGKCLQSKDAQQQQRSSLHLADTMKEAIFASYRLTPTAFTLNQFTYPEGAEPKPR